MKVGREHVIVLAVGVLLAIAEGYAAERGKECCKGSGAKEVRTLIDGKVFVYHCRKYDPPQVIVCFADGGIRRDTPKNVIISLYTQMKRGNWERFKSLWRNFDKDYTSMGIEPPKKDAYVKKWKEIMKRAYYFRYIIKYGAYTLVVVDSCRKPGGKMSERDCFALKKVRKGYYLTRELTLDEDRLESALSDIRFDPWTGRFRGEEKLEGKGAEKGKKKGK